MENNKLDKNKLGIYLTTAIGGNDVLSSTLYVSSIAILYAGVFAPIVLILVGIVLYFYRSVHMEVVESLPVNGGAYNALLNGTSKTVAAIAGIMTILSYVATAVISSKAAVEYLFYFLYELSIKFDLNISYELLQSFVIPTVIFILCFFALLVYTGIKHSSKIALIIFIVFIFTLILFIAIGLLYILNNGFSLFNANILSTKDIILNKGGIGNTIFLAFSASLLGVAGFESSADFIEDQKRGILRETLRNIIIGVLIFNPLISFILLNILPFDQIVNSKDSILAISAFKINGIFLEGWICINAFTVLCGAVITSFIGVSGLANRMVLDECLPSVLKSKNKSHISFRVILAFLLICISILLITKGNILSLAGVYTVAFLCVMALFAIGALVLRATRKDLKRGYTAPFSFILIALFTTLIGLMGNFLIDKRHIIYFLIYFIPLFTLVLVLMYKRDLLKNLLKFTKHFKSIHRIVESKYDEIVHRKLYIFIHKSVDLYKILRYLDLNESTCEIILVHCAEEQDDEKEKIKNLIPIIRDIGAFTDLNIEYIYLDEEFGPESIDRFSKKHRIPKNRMFIGSIKNYHKFNFEDLGEVRIIN